MIILGIDSTANVCSAAICDNDRLLGEIQINTGNTHSEILLPAIEEVLRLSNTDIDDIELFSASIGPGSFTGVRIGAATIKGLAFGKNVPCCEVSSLASLAQNLSAFDGILCPVINARRMQVYNALFSCKDGVITRLTPDRAISIEELDAELSAYGEKIYMSGDGYDICKKHFVNTKTENIPSKMRLHSGYSTCICGLENYKNSNTVTDKELSPSYLRLSQAERERNEKLNSGIKL